MIARVKTLKALPTVILMYCPNLTYKSLFYRELRGHFDIALDNATEYSTLKTLKTAALQADIKPFRGKYWLLSTRVDGVTVTKDLLSTMSLVPQYGIIVYDISKYRLFKLLSKRNDLKCIQAYMGKLTDDDVYWFHDTYVARGGEALEPGLLRYVVTNYRYDIDAVCSLFDGSMRFETKADIHDLVGLGGVTVDSFLVKILLLQEPSRRRLRNIFLMYQALLSKHTPETLRSFILASLQGMTEVKELQLTGRMSRHRLAVPEGYDLSRVQRLSRFHEQLLYQISLSRIILLYSVLKGVPMQGGAERTTLVGLLEYFGKIGEC